MRLDRRKRRLKVGDRVRFYYGERRVRGVVVEDRGFIGAGGRHLVSVYARSLGPDSFEIHAEGCTK